MQLIHISIEKANSRTLFIIEYIMLNNHIYKRVQYRLPSKILQILQIKQTVTVKSYRIKL